MRERLPLISIIIPNYNYGEFVVDAITSALNQTYERTEVIVVDDGSTDDSLSLISQFPVKLISQANMGVMAARNNGAVHSRGDYLVFLDADDILKPDYIEKCLSVLIDAPPEVGYVYTHMELFGTESGLFEVKKFSVAELLRNNFVNTSALLRRKAFFDAGGFDESWPYPMEDYEFWVRLLTFGYEGVLLPEALLRYRRHASSRNTLTCKQRRKIKWQIKASYPGLYARFYRERPFKLAKLMVYTMLRKTRGDRERNSLSPTFEAGVRVKIGY